MDGSCGWVLTFLSYVKESGGLGTGIYALQTFFTCWEVRDFKWYLIH